MICRNLLAERLDFDHTLYTRKSDAIRTTTAIECPKILKNLLDGVGKNGCINILQWHIVSFHLDFSTVTLSSRSDDSKLL